MNLYNPVQLIFVWKSHVFSPYSDQNGKKNLKSRYKKRPKNDIFPQKTILQDPSGSWVKFITSPLKILQFGTGKTGAHLGQSLKKVWKLLFFYLSLTTCVSSPNGLLGCLYRPRRPKNRLGMMYLGWISFKNLKLDPYEPFSPVKKSKRGTRSLQNGPIWPKWTHMLLLSV